MRVMLVHGWHMTGLELVLLGLRLRRAGFVVERFRYRSRREAPREAGRRLADQLREIDGSVALVGHSLGGHVIRHAVAGLAGSTEPDGGMAVPSSRSDTSAAACGARRPEARVSAVVFLGSPLAGSAVARRLFEQGGWRRRWLGCAWSGGLDGRSPLVRGVPTLMIAGVRPGWSRWLTHGLAIPNDGTVALSETRAEDVVEHRSFATGHMGLVVNRLVAQTLIEFLLCIADGETPGIRRESASD
ncbi:MAG: esterase/lipase family protein [Thioalkalivibrionaceae bacterium]